MKKKGDPSWRYQSKRISKEDLQEVITLLNDAYFLMEDDEEILKDAEKEKVMDLEKAKDLLLTALGKIEIEWEDLPLTRLDEIVDKLNEAAVEVTEQVFTVSIDKDSERRRTLY